MCFSRFRPAGEVSALFSSIVHRRWSAVPLELIRIDDQQLFCVGERILNTNEYLTQAEAREKAGEKIETHHCLLPSHRTGHFPFRTARTTRRVRVSSRTAPLSSTSATKANDRRRRLGHRYRAPTTTTPRPSWHPAAVVAPMPPKMINRSRMRSRTDRPTQHSASSA